MKLTIIAVSIIGVALSACSSAPQKNEAASAPVSSMSTAANKVPAITKPLAVASETEAQKLDRIVRALASNSIYFDFDKSSIKPEYMETIKQNYELLKANPQASIRLEGNTDERGSAEYNLALGQKRADEVRKALVALGIDATRFETVSYGKEKPRCTEHDEQCWSKNRRVDFAGK